MSRFETLRCASLASQALEGFDVKVESEHLSKLAESKEELISKVSGLKRDLLEWRTKLDGQVKTFRGVRCP